MILMTEGRPWVASRLVSIPAAVDVEDWYYHCFSSFLGKFVLYLEYDRPHAKVNDKMDETSGMCKSIINPVDVRARSFEQE